MFADDTAILAQSNELQLVTHFLHKHIAKLEDWFSTWKIDLNVAKTEAVFSYHIKKEPPKLYLHNTHIPWSKNTKYLGVILDKRLTFKQHIIRVRRNFNISIAKVFPLIARKSCLSLRNKLLIYKLVLRPVLQYASPIWGHAAYSNIEIEFERVLIIWVKTAGWSTRRVAGQVDRSECAVRNCWEQWTREGTHTRKTVSKATRNTTRREDGTIVRQALVDPTVTRSTIRAGVGVAIVPQTISRHLAKANLKSKRPFRAFPLTPKHLQLRLQWCQARSMWNVTDWQKVVFSDESRFV
ncbi:RNA-directed DNA polymerase from mobile element jockey [Trichonephila clavipes]|nr:RNA-directed DNA polymerase from mobile element jockey [Trichonephila clavipes]